MKKKTKDKINVIWTKIKIAIKEIGNLVTNVLCPLTSILVIAAGIFQLPASVILTLKKVEEWLWKFAGTKDTVNDLVEKINENVEKIEVD